MNVAVYARYSSSNQREESIEDQLREIQKYCDREGYTIVKTYTDSALTGRTTKRHGFTQLIGDSSSGAFQAVVVYKGDRFARDRTDARIYKRLLADNGVKFISITENFGEGPAAIFGEAMAEAVAEWYSVNLAADVMRGHMGNAGKCIHNGGTPPLGYDLTPDRKYYVINDFEAAAIRIIFERYADGYSYGYIISELNNLGHKTKAGREFGNNSLHELLINEKYKGTYVYSRRENKYKSRNKRSNRTYKSDDEIVRVENGVPAIVTPELWEKVQEKMKNNKRGTNKAIEVYLLSGIIHCGDCTYAMCGNRRVTRGKVYRSYECVNRKRNKACTKCNIPAEEIESHVLDYAEKTLFSPDGMDTIAGMVLDQLNKTISESDTELPRLRKELQHYQKVIDNLNQAVIDGFYNKNFNEISRDADLKIDFYKTEISRIEALKNEPEITKQKIIDALSIYSDIKKKSPSEQKAILQKFIVDVVVYDEKVDISASIDTCGFDGARCPLLLLSTIILS